MTNRLTAWSIPPASTWRPTRATTADRRVPNRRQRVGDDADQRRRIAVRDRRRRHHVRLRLSKDGKFLFVDERGVAQPDRIQRQRLDRGADDGVHAAAEYARRQRLHCQRRASRRRRIAGRRCRWRWQDRRGDLPALDGDMVCRCSRAPTTRPTSRNRGGASTDVAVPGDYDGDGKTDLAVYRPSTGMWFVLVVEHQLHDLPRRNRGGQHRHAGAGRLRRRRQDRPGGLPALDRDVVCRCCRAPTTRPTSRNRGGSSTDIAGAGRLRRRWQDRPGGLTGPRRGRGSCLQSSTNYTTYVAQRGESAPTSPVPGDYDGDGKTDLAVFRPSTAIWFTSVVEHQLHDLPLPAVGPRHRHSRAGRLRWGRQDRPGGLPALDGDVVCVAVEHQLHDLPLARWGAATDLPLNHRP